LVSQSPPWWVHSQQKHKVWSSNPRPHEAQLEDLKSHEKAQEGYLEEGKPQKSANGMKSGKAKQNGKEELRKAQKSKKNSNQGKSSKSTLLWNQLPLTLSMQALPLR
jgi:hypothetical protein